MRSEWIDLYERHKSRYCIWYRDTESDIQYNDPYSAHSIKKYLPRIELEISALKASELPLYKVIITHIDSTKGANLKTKK